MAGPRIPQVKKISNEVFQSVQRAIPPAKREELSSAQWVKISMECDQFALDAVRIIEAPADSLGETIEKDG